MIKIAKRLREPSTYAGIGVLLGLFGVQIAPDLMQTGVQAVSGIAGLAAILMSEKGGA